MLNSLEVANPDITDLTVFWLLVTYMLYYLYRSHHKWDRDLSGWP